MAETDIKVIVAAHKPYWVPSDPVYLPVQMGASGKPSLGYQRDDEGDNISAKNAHYCELTGLYWAWKNLDADFLGLVHYRRYFEGRTAWDKRGRIATGEQLREHLDEAPVLLPVKRNYFIETSYSQYVHAHHEEDLVATRKILAERYPGYLAAYDRSMGRTTGHRFNMFVMRRDLLDAYCTWLFDVLGELEARLDISPYGDYDARVFGFVAERLLDPWIETNGIDYVALPVVNLESQHWLRKGTSFLRRKFVGRGA